jgi:hypothetical protein
MDLLERINALTDDQLRMVAERDDASGVLASYRLAELRGLPAPEKSIVVMGEGYAIVAQDGKITRVATDGMAKIIREEGDEYCVYSHDGTQAFGCYPTREEAEERLRQIHYFSDEDRKADSVSVGDHVLYAVPKPPGPTTYAHGRVDRIEREGSVTVPGTNETVEATSDDPVAVITVWAQTESGFQETDRRVAKPFSELRVSSEPLEKASAKVMETLRDKAKAHNESVGDAASKRTSARTLGAVFDRGVGAYRTNPGSVRPSVTSAEQWAYGRVNGFLYALKNGKFKRKPYDTDLLPKGHPLSTKKDLEKETFKPPEGVQEAAQRALEWISEGHAGSGFTDVGRARAAQLARGDNVSERTIRRIAAYFSRHQPDRQAEGFNAGEDGFPSPGRVAWDAWGGDPGKRWADAIVRRLNNADKDTCPRATHDVELNLENRQNAIDVAMYGPLNPEEPNEDYWEELAEVFETDAEEAKKSRCGNCAAFDVTTHMKDCIASGLEGDSEDPYDVVEAGELGYCRMFKFKCASARTCSAWISGGPITDEDVESEEESDKALAKAQGFVRKADEKQFTLGPLYVPDFMDAHGEWTDSEELQPAVWEWVKSGDRRIYLQHDREVEAGEWVEVMTMPQSWTVMMRDPDGTDLGEVTYPPNTTFLGVIWNDEAWEMIKAGKLRGYSIGGFSDRVMADLPDKAAREGVEMPGSKEELDLAKTVALAVAEAMKTASPTVNVVMPESKRVTRRVERDDQGNIARIVEEEE